MLSREQGKCMSIAYSSLVRKMSTKPFVGEKTTIQNSSIIASSKTPVYYFSTYKELINVPNEHIWSGL